VGNAQFGTFYLDDAEVELGSQHETKMAIISEAVAGRTLRQYPLKNDAQTHDQTNAAWHIICSSPDQCSAAHLRAL